MDWKSHKKALRVRRKTKRWRFPHRPLCKSELPFWRCYDVMTLKTILWIVKLAYILCIDFPDIRTWSYIRVRSGLIKCFPTSSCMYIDLHLWCQVLYSMTNGLEWFRFRLIKRCRQYRVQLRRHLCTCTCAYLATFRRLLRTPYSINGEHKIKNDFDSCMTASFF